MRTIFNFILYFVFFGLLFFAISLYFPDAFETLLSWVKALFNFLRDIIQWLVEKINAATKT